MSKYSQSDNANNMVNLAIGQPSTFELPIEWFKETLNKLSNELIDHNFLQYHNVIGNDVIREKLADWLNKRYYLNPNNKLETNNITKDKLCMTNGNIGAIQLIMQLLMESNDDIIIEDPSYFGTTDMFDEYGLNLNKIPMELDGINVGLLEEKIIEILKDEERNIQSRIFLYTIPVHHNPTSITLSHAKKLQIAKLCEKYPKFYVIADEVYYFLNFDKNDKYNPFADYHSNIISLGSFSNIIAPALRVGWIYQNVKNDGLSVIKVMKKSACLNLSGGLNPLGFKIIESALINNSIDSMIDKNIEILKKRYQTIIEYLKPHLNNIKLFIIPKGGYFIWLKLDFDTNDFYKFAENFKILFQPGKKFGTNYNKYIRLSFSYCDSDNLITGLSRLIEAYSLFTKIKISIFDSTDKIGTLIKNEIEKIENLYFYDEIYRNIYVNPLTDIIINVSSTIETLNLLTYLIDNDINKPLIICANDLNSKTLDLIRIYSITNSITIVKEETDIFIKKCIEFIPEIIKRSCGIYNTFESLSEEKDYKIYKTLGNICLITNNNNYIQNFPNNSVDYIVVLPKKNPEYNWLIYNKTGEKLKINGNEILAVAKYLNNEFNIKTGKIENLNTIFKFENKKYYFETPLHKEYTIEDIFRVNLIQLINQITGLNVIGVSKFYIVDYKHLIIEIKEDLFDIDSDIITTLGTIINCEKEYNISFINLKKNNIIRVKYFDFNKNMETDGNVYACSCILDYYAEVNELSYDDDIEISLLFNKDIVKTYFKSDRYFISYEPTEM